MHLKLLANQYGNAGRIICLWIKLLFNCYFCQNSLFLLRRYIGLLYDNIHNKKAESLVVLFIKILITRQLFSNSM